MIFFTKKTFQKVVFKKIFALLFLMLFIGVSYAQQAQLFQQGNLMMRDGNYEKALEYYLPLIEMNPGNVTVIDRAVQAMVALKQYDRAVETLRKLARENPDFPNLTVKIGEIYHMSGDLNGAKQAWQEMIEENPGNIQIYRLVAESMVNRRLFVDAAELLDNARKMMGNEQLFGFEIAQYYSAAGDYESTMREYSKLLTLNSGYLTTIIRQLSRFDDDYFVDTGILEIEESSRNLSPESAEWIAHRELLVWLYMERNLYRRALATARNLEDRLDEKFPVFDLGKTFANINEFELSEDAFKRYSENTDHPLFGFAREELAQLYIYQARYLIENNLDFGTKSSSLYQSAYDLLVELLEMQPNFERKNQVLVVLAEISLDYLKNSAKAFEWMNILEKQRLRGNDAIRLDYLRGRMHMFEGDFNRARITFTRANRAARTGHIAEKTRFFLSLNDFYNHEFDFAGLQLRSLQRQPTSYYANNALRLKTWIQDGLIDDAPSDEIIAYSRAHFFYNSGMYEEALEALMLFSQPGDQPLKADALFILSDIMRKNNPLLGYHILNENIINGFKTTQKERLLWERARLADALYHISDDEVQSLISDNLKAKIAGFENLDDLMIEKPDLATVTDIYESMLMQFPQGFYAAAGRDRIRTLITQTRS